jgi:hypothetical protein
VSNTFSDAKVEALRCAVTAYGRHPNNIVLFRGLLDLAISNLRRRKVGGFLVRKTCVDVRLRRLMLGYCVRAMRRIACGRRSGR